MPSLIAMDVWESLGNACQKRASWIQATIQKQRQLTWVWNNTQMGHFLFCGCVDEGENETRNWHFLSFKDWE